MAMAKLASSDRRRAKDGGYKDAGYPPIESAGYLVRALREGRLSLFAAALAKLGELDAKHVRDALDAPTPDPLQLACAGVGVDRSAFPSILLMVRGLNAGRPGAATDAPAPPPPPPAGGVTFVMRAAKRR